MILAILAYSIFYDLIVVVVLIYCVFSCYREGFLHSLITIFSCFFSFFISNFSRKFVMKFFLFSGLFKSFSNPEVSGKLADGAFEPFFGQVFSRAFLNSKGARGLNFFGSPAVSVFSLVLFFVLFKGFRFFFNRALKFSKFVNRLPILGSVDGILGGVCGVFKAVFYLFIFSMVCFLIIILTQNKLDWLNVGVIKNTHLFFLFYWILNILGFSF